MATLHPFGETGAVSVATTSTSDGADLLVSGISPEGAAKVLRFGLTRPDDSATSLVGNLIGEVASGGAVPVIPGGD
jgi:hypothetical protein